MTLLAKDFPTPKVVAKGCIHAWGWWLSELSAMLPQGVRRNLAKTRPAIISVDGDGTLRLTGDAPISAATASDDNRKWKEDLFLEIRDQYCLSKSILLPRKAHRHLSGIIGHEVSRLSPLMPECIYYTYHIQKQGVASNNLHVNLRLIRRNYLDNAIKTCAEQRLFPTALRCEDGTLVSKGSLPKLSRPPFFQRAFRMGLLALIALAPVLWGALLLIEANRLQGILDGVMDEMIVERKKSQEVDYIASKSKTIANDIKNILSQKNQGSIAKYIAEISNKIPIDTWLYGLFYENGAFRISGYSKSAASLLSILDEHPAFNRSQFRSPLVRTGMRDMERFEISFEKSIEK